MNLVGNTIETSEKTCSPSLKGETFTEGTVTLEWNTMSNSMKQASGERTDRRNRDAR